MLFNCVIILYYFLVNPYTNTLKHNAPPTIEAVNTRFCGRNGRFSVVSAYCVLVRYFLSVKRLKVYYNDFEKFYHIDKGVYNRRQRMTQIPQNFFVLIIANNYPFEQDYSNKYKAMFRNSLLNFQIK
jgi:hypothetical protein